MTRERVMLLIDADNVSLDVIEQALALLLAQHGAVHLRRAYCTAESALKHQAAFKRLGIRPMVNLAAGKNSTDIALAVDAIDLVVAEQPEVVVIASSDSDFAPLVARLREKGCRVRGIGQQGKTGDDTQAVYDDYTVLEHKPGAARKTAARKVAAKRAAPARPDTEPVLPAEPAKAAAPRSARAGAGAAPRAAAQRAPKAAAGEAPQATPAPPARPARKTAARGTARAKAAQPAVAAPAAAPPAPPVPPVRHAPPAAPAPAAEPLLGQLLGCLPELAAGQTLPLNTVAERLRGAGLLSRRGSSLKLLARFPQRFELLPADQPQAVRGLAGR